MEPNISSQFLPFHMSAMRHEGKDMRHDCLYLNSSTNLPKLNGKLMIHERTISGRHRFLGLYYKIVWVYFMPILKLMNGKLMNIQNIKYINFLRNKKMMF